MTINDIIDPIIDPVVEPEIEVTATIPVPDPEPVIVADPTPETIIVSDPAPVIVPPSDNSYAEEHARRHEDFEQHLQQTVLESESRVIESISNIRSEISSEIKSTVAEAIDAIPKETPATIEPALITEPTLITPDIPEKGKDGGHNQHFLRKFGF